MLEEVKQANKSGVTAWNYAKSKGILSTLSDSEAAIFDKYGVKMLDDGAGDGTPVKFSKMTSDETMKIAQEYRKKAPIEIPESAAIKPRTMNNGYDQISYKWRESGYKYEVRWHSRTPDAPFEQGNTWVVQREIPGSGGQNPRSFIKIGNTGTDADWVSGHKWYDAIKARQNGTATLEQIKILDVGHWKE
jgi:hypothetical protein